MESTAAPSKTQGSWTKNPFVIMIAVLCVSVTPLEIYRRLQPQQQPLMSPGLGPRPQMPPTMPNQDSNGKQAFTSPASVTCPPQPSEPDVKDMYEKSVVARDNKDFDQQWQLLKQVIQRQPDHRWALTDATTLLTEPKAYDKMKQKEELLGIQKLVEAVVGNECGVAHFQANNAITMCKWHAKYTSDQHEVIKCLEEERKVSGESPYWHYNMFQARQQLWEFDKAYAHIKAAFDDGKSSGYRFPNRGTVAAFTAIQRILMAGPNPGVEALKEAEKILLDHLQNFALLVHHLRQHTISIRVACAKPASKAVFLLQHHVHVASFLS